MTQLRYDQFDLNYSEINLLLILLIYLLTNQTI